MKNKVLKIILIASFLPYVWILICGIYSIFSGFTFLFTTSYGFTAFVDCICVMALVLCVYPVLPICLIYQLFYLIRYLIKKNKLKKEVE